jgi:hypothetical protein
MKTLNGILITVAIGLTIAASSARADTFTFTSDHCSGGCGPQAGGFGTVTLTQVGANVNVFISLNNNNQWVETGAGGGMNFLFDDAGIGIGNITSIVSSIGKPMQAKPMQAMAGAIHADGTGDWMWGIFCNNCAQGGAGAFGGTISFTVTNTTLAQMEVGHFVSGVGQELFVADILSGTSGNTGDVDVNTNVPDGGTTLMLLGSALSGLGLARRFFWR